MLPVNCKVLSEKHPCVLDLITERAAVNVFQIESCTNRGNVVTKNKRNLIGQ